VSRVGVKREAALDGEGQIAPIASFVAGLEVVVVCRQNRKPPLRCFVHRAAVCHIEIYGRGARC